MYRIVTPFLILSLALALPHQKFNPNEGRIVGGENTTIDLYPHQASFEFHNVPGYVDGHNCGGSIISEIFIVTAGHCAILTTRADQAFVRVNSTFVERGGALHAVKTIHYYPDYDPYTKDSDIGILELEEPIAFTAGAQPIGLPDKSDHVAAGTLVSVSGWGTLNSGGTTPEQLQVVQVPIVDRQVCDQAYDSSGYPITDSMICAGYLEEGGKDSCQGDSGGPLVADGKLYGIVSWGIGCALPGYPGVYSDVAYLRDFITEVTGL